MKNYLKPMAEHVKFWEEDSIMDLPSVSQGTGSPFSLLPEDEDAPRREG